MISMAGCDSNSSATSLEDQSEEFEENPTRDTLTEVHKYIFNILAWEPSLAKGSHSLSHRLPTPCRKFRFFTLKVDPLCSLTRKM